MWFGRVTTIVQSGGIIPVIMSLAGKIADIFHLLREMTAYVT